MTTNDILSYTNPYSPRGLKRRSKKLQKVVSSTSKFFEDYKRSTITKAEFNAIPDSYEPWPVNFGHHNGRANNSRFHPIPIIFKDGTRTCSVGSHLRVCTHPSFEGYVEVEWFEACPTHCGLGHMAMEQICAIADKHKQRLILVACPLMEHREPTPQEIKKLMNFYKKHGFVTLAENTMTRVP